MFKKEIQIPIYKGVLAFCIGDDKEEITDYFDLGDLLPEVIFAHSFYTSKDYEIKDIGVFLIILNFKYEMPITYGIITHEINHIGNMILNYRRIDPNYDNDEAEAYLKEWIANELYSFLSEINMLKKVKVGQIKYLK